MVRNIIANDVAAGFDFRFPLQFCLADGFGLAPSKRIVSGSTPLEATNIAAGGRYAASYAAHRGFESRPRFQTCASSPTAEAANLKSATVLVRIQRGAPYARVSQRQRKTAQTRFSSGSNPLSRTIFAERASVVIARA
jgi:hypothetical protein